MLEFLTLHILKTRQEQLKKKHSLMKELELSTNTEEQEYIKYKINLLEETIHNLQYIRHWLLQEKSIEVEDVYIAISDLINFLWFNHVTTESGEMYTILYDNFFVNDFFIKWENLDDAVLFVELKERETWNCYEFALGEFLLKLDYFEDWSDITYVPLSLWIAFEQCYQNLTNY